MNMQFSKATVLATLAVILAACGGGSNVSDLEGTVTIDGSSTVYPIFEGIAEEFSKAYPSVDVTVNFSGTGGGFTQFAQGNTDLSNASRPIKTSEATAAAANGIEFTELLLAQDGLSVVVSDTNTWLTDITVAELARLWLPAGDDASTDDVVETNVPPTKWNQVNASWPDQTIVLYGPGTDSGTFDFFTEEILGEVGNIRSDFFPSEDDNILVQGVSTSQYALAYFGYAYYLPNVDTLRAIPIIDGERGVAPAVAPTFETISDGSYSPLARPLFTYVNNAKYVANEALRAFLTFTMEEGKPLIDETGYISLPPENYEAHLETLADLLA